MDRVATDGQRAHQIDRRLVAVDAHRRGPGALRQLADRLRHALAAAADDRLAQHIEIAQREFAHHRHQPAAADLVARDQRIDIADHLHRLANIGADHRQQVLVHLAGTREPQQRDEQTLVVDLPAFRRLADAAHIDQMRRAGEQRHDAPVHEGRRHHDQIVEMAGALPRIVGDVDIAFLHLGDREHVEEMPDRTRHGVDVTRRAGDRLRQHPALQVEHAGGDVAGLARRGAEGGAHQGLCLLLHHGQQTVPHDLEFDLRDVPARHASISSITMSSPAPMRAV